MPPKKDPVQDRIKAFNSTCEHSDPETVKQLVKQLLGDRHCLPVARAAEVSSRRCFYDMEDDLLKAYRRFLKNPVKNDPNCIAKGAIARALVDLDCKDYTFFIAGLHYRQHEPVWGTTVDTAVEVRVSCAMGLAQTSYPRTLIELVATLHDPEPPVRIGAARAIICTQPLAAEAVLRAKALAKDSEIDVTAQVLTALLHVAPDDSRDFVSGYLENQTDPELIEAISFSLGESRLDAALDVLKSCWDNQPLKRKQEHAFLKGAVFHRSEHAFSWLLDVVADEDRISAMFIIEALAIYRTNERLKTRMKKVVSQRADDKLSDLFQRVWNKN
ncbi:MAG: HEAT repeat domain-containing protein [Desulfobacterales bacterium]|nr:HEAT repeat domain-containing protein [Desulfobacterales bacterium]